MSKKAFDKIARGLSEALDFARGELKPVRLYIPALSRRDAMTSMDDEILAAACAALDKAHALLSDVVRLNGQMPPAHVEFCRGWVDGEYDPGTHMARPCKHVPMRAALDGSMSCIRCGMTLGTAA